MIKAVVVLLSLTASIGAQAGIYGVKLVSFTQHSSVSGFAMVASNVGVEDGGLGAQQSFLLTKTSGSYSGGMGANSSASDYWSLSIDVFWLQQSINDQPPGTLSLKRTNASACSSSAYAEKQGTSPAWITGSSYASAGGLTLPAASATKDAAGSYTQSQGGGIYESTSTSVTIANGWTLVTYVNGMPLYKTTTPISLTTPTVSVSGTSYGSGYPGAYLTTNGMSSAALGVSHRFFAP